MLGVVDGAHPAFAEHALDAIAPTDRLTDELVLRLGSQRRRNVAASGLHSRRWLAGSTRDGRGAGATTDREGGVSIAWMPRVRVWLRLRAAALA